MAGTGISSITKNALQNYVLDSNEALEFKLVKCPEDLEDESTTFRPEMSHQVYGDSEQIFGYSGLRIKVYYSACRLTTYLSYTYGERVNPEKFEGVKPDEVIKPIAERIPPGYLTNLEDFVASLEKDASFRPYGEMTHRFTAATESGEQKTLEVYFCDGTTPNFLDYHQRFQTFILWYIDAASYIDTDDDKWRFFVTYEKFQADGQTRYAFVGFASVYQYYAYPDNIRPRISQMLVLPPFQRLGVGTEMLKTIYMRYQDDPKVLDITVEDPSDNFARLRDYVDSKNCMKLDSFHSEKLNQGYSEAMVDEAKTKLKLNKRQIRRVYEILRLRATNLSDNEAYRKYRLDVKSRLNIQYKKEDRYMEKLKKMLRPEEYAATVSTTSQDQRVESLDRQYSQLEDHYLHILDRIFAQ
ncbi:hypothetical protein Pmani_005495 [Petrolisthes manimaculis]|uniref:Histone acetyltransferase type B catalytic subunit n=1 Tax=Petrolisthes manimaculis TaxID=1843537 RepID=A0AAE1UKI6_9EUCA|nr:hypothetical protein Pmani_005495 [Petrolisthes manimaculis]